MIFISIFLFCAGIYLVLTRKNAIMALIGIELIFNAANLNFVAFHHLDPNFNGIYFALFAIAITAAESAIAIAIILNLYKTTGSINLDETTENRE